MLESWSAHFNEIKEAIERFEKMEYNKQEYFFDVHSIESIFDYYMDQFELAKAERIIQLGLRQHPGSTSLKIKEAIIFIEKEQLSKAAAILEHVMSIEKSNPEVYLNLGYIYFREGDRDKAIQTLELGLKYAGDENDILLDTVLYLNQFQEYSTTIRLLSARYPKIKNDENLLFELAYALDKIGDNHKAHDIYEEVLDLNPYSENAWYNLGISLVKLDNLEEAVDAFDFCLTINPDHAQAHFNKGNSLAQQNRYLEALDCYLNCISYDLEQSKCLQYIADCWHKLGNSSKAIQFFELAIKSDIIDFDTWESYARFYLELQKPKKCRQIIKQALEEKDLMTNEEQGTFYHLTAQSYVLDEKWKLSKDYFVKATRCNSKEFRHPASLFKLEKALNPEYNIELFVYDYTSKLIEAPSFQYMLAAYHLLITENLKKSFYHLKEAISNAPGFIDELTDLFPEILDIAKNNNQLSNLIELNNRNYEL
ncbi:tetratricopeptide repeat protein [Thermophagus xiamenensis]|uniref:Lipopolysaccharide biosynthesis regulator YciM, contains six TPR domains and a predicted metal-binding C-terminal domain n=1 Tax=Thermophagus xiamenensis TaxID=385682 RepID=A0A1I2B4R9_9BACT|nr:tetratricopeptide repeat protein [Thermophagus xiamenensis]SFE50283.1 Lipopolysaccharide biosynthesis regulator YciM, contains six TPR domains and a predicted metal-binding C-terminal domain [Thermophagus xiamenensis]